MAAHRSRRIVVTLLAAALVAAGATACDVRVAGRRCAVAGATAQDATHLLVCTNGRWARSLTKPQVALILLAVVQSQTSSLVAAGNGHTCLTMENGDVRCAGFNSSLQLGDGTTTNQSRFVPAIGANGEPRVRLTLPTAGAESTCALQVGALDAGPRSPDLRCWGFNGFGQLGDGTTVNRAVAPVVLTGGVTAAAAGTVHTCASLDTGAVRCWGQNAGGQLGNGTTDPSGTPVAVSGITNGTHVAAGGSHSCAVAGAFDDPARQIRCWGANGSGQLGDGTTTARTTPVPVALANPTGIDAGGESTCATTAERRLFCWGANGSGQLGDGTTTSRSAPTEVTGIVGVETVSVGQDHTCAVVAASPRGNTVYCWGDNSRGQLGDGTTTSRATPVEVVIPGDGEVRSLSAGFGHTCAVAGGATYCWGRNDLGQLGDGTTTDRTAPVVTRL